MTAPGGQLFDIGYQRYDGPREGRMGARKALWLNGVRTSLGLGRGLMAKLFPSLLVGVAVLLAIIITMVATFGPPDDEIPGPAGYYQILSYFLLLFSAIIVPELVCPDLRNRVIHLYLVRPVTPLDYVAMRWLAYFSIALGIVWLGQTVMFTGLALGADAPLDHVRDNWLDVPRYLLGGVVLASFATAIPLALSSFTTRRGYAQAFVIGLFFVSIPLAAILTECEEEFHEGQEAEPGSRVECNPITGSQAKWAALVDLPRAPVHVTDVIFAEENSSVASELIAELPGFVPIGWYLLLVLGSSVVLWSRYRRITS